MIEIKETQTGEMQIGIYDAKTNFPSLVAQVEKGESVVITRHGKPVARLVSVEGDKQYQKRMEAIERLRNAYKGNRLNGLTVRELIDEGRR